VVYFLRQTIWRTLEICNSLSSWRPPLYMKLIDELNRLTHWGESMLCGKQNLVLHFAEGFSVLKHNASASQRRGWKWARIPAGVVSRGRSFLVLRARCWSWPLGASSREECCRFAPTRASTDRKRVFTYAPLTASSTSSLSRDAERKPEAMPGAVWTLLRVGCPQDSSE